MENIYITVNYFSNCCKASLISIFTLTNTNTPWNATPWTGRFNAYDRLSQRKAVLVSFSSIFDGSKEKVHRHVTEFTRRMEDTRLITTFDVRIGENPRQKDIQENDWEDNPRRFEIKNVLTEFPTLTLAQVQGERDN